MSTAIENFQVCRQSGLRLGSLLDAVQKFYVVGKTCVELVTFFKSLQPVNFLCSGSSLDFLFYSS